MFDFLVLALIAAAFAVATVYARFCDRLARPHASAGEDER